MLQLWIYCFICSCWDCWKCITRGFLVNRKDILDNFLAGFCSFGSLPFQAKPEILFWQVWSLISLSHHLDVCEETCGLGRHTMRLNSDCRLPDRRIARPRGGPTRVRRELVTEDQHGRGLLSGDSLQVLRVEHRALQHDDCQKYSLDLSQENNSKWSTLTQKYETLVFSLFSNPSNMRSGSFLLRKTTYRWNISTKACGEFLLTSVLVSSLAGWKKSLRNPLTLSKLIFPQTMMNCRWGLTWKILVFLIPISTVHHSVH